MSFVRSRSLSASRTPCNFLRVSSPLPAYYAQSMMATAHGWVDRVRASEECPLSAYAVDEWSLISHFPSHVSRTPPPRRHRRDSVVGARHHSLAACHRPARPIALSSLVHPHAGLLPAFASAGGYSAASHDRIRPPSNIARQRAFFSRAISLPLNTAVERAGLPKSLVAPARIDSVLPLTLRPSLSPALLRHLALLRSTLPALYT